MIELLYQLSRSFAFVRIRHPQMRWVILYFPSFLATLSLVCFLALPIQPPLSGNDGITRQCMSLLSTLPGFFIAALAVVATFEHKTLDESMPTPSPTLVLRKGNSSDSVSLTMRMFLSHLFAFLTAISFVAILFCLAGEVLAPNVKLLISTYISSPRLSAATQLAEASYVFVLTWFISEIAITTLFGMYFLAERIHRPNS